MKTVQRTIFTLLICSLAAFAQYPGPQPVNCHSTSADSGVTNVCTQPNMASSCVDGLIVNWTPATASGTSPTLNACSASYPILTNEAAAPATSLFAANTLQVLHFSTSSTYNSGAGAWVAQPIIVTTTGYSRTGTSPGNFAPTATTQSGTAGSVVCSQSMQGTLKIATCYLNAYANTSTAQTYAFPTAFSTTPVLSESGGSCGTYNPTTTSSTLTLPANASMSAETCNVVLIGQ